MTKLNFIITTINGYVIERLPLVDLDNKTTDEVIDTLYEKEFTSKRIGNVDSYVDDIAGNVDDIETFIKNKDNSKCEDGKETLNFNANKNTYIEAFHTDVVGYYSDIYVGLEIK